MIEIKHLSFSYGREPLLRDVSLTAQAGECVGILGNNGAGKSTLITCVNRLRKPDGGDVVIDGRPVSAMGRRELAKTVAYVAQQTERTEMTVFDYVLLGRRPYFRWGASQEDMELCGAMLRRVGMEAFQVRALDELSGGEAQKVLLARALVQQPKVLLLDEPTSSLDPRNQYEMLGLVRQLAREQGFTALIVIHDLNLALRYCDRFYFLKDGAGYRCGGPEAVDRETIETVYGVSARVLEVDGQKLVMIE